MKANDIKKFFTSKGIPARIKTSKHFIEAWIPYLEVGKGKYIPNAVQFPLDLRVKALKVIYGESFENNGIAGNIRESMMTMKPGEWEKLLS